MPVLIPNPRSVSPIIQSGVAPVATRNPVGTPQFAESAANATNMMTKQQTEIYMQHVENEVAKAKTHVALGRIEQDSSYEQDQEFDTVEERWTKEMNDHLGEAAGMISDPIVREAFIEQQTPALAEGQVAIRQKIFKRKADWEIGQAKNATDTIIKGALSDYGDMQNAYDATATIWENMATQGYTSYEASQDMIRKIKYDMAVGKLKTMAPADQIEALKDNWAKDLPLDVRVELERKANERLRLGQAQGAAYEAFTQGMNQTQADEHFYKTLKDNPELLVEAQSQFSTLHNNKAKDDVDKTIDLYSEYDQIVRNGGTTLDIMNSAPNDWDLLTPAMRTNLTELEKRQAKGEPPPTYSNRAVKTELLRLWGQGAAGRAKAKLFFFENSAYLNETDFDDWNEKVYQGQPESLFDVQKQVEQLTVNMGDSHRANVYNRITRWYFAYQRRNEGATPSDEEVQSAINTAITNYDTGIITSERLANMDIDDRVDAYARIKDQTEREEFLMNFDQSEEFEIRTRYLRSLDDAVFDDVMSSFDDPKTATYRQIEERFAVLLKMRNKPKPPLDIDAIRNPANPSNLRGAYGP